MRQFLALCTLLFLWCTATTAFAAPSQDDRAQVSTLFFFDVQPAAILYDAPDLQTADLSPDIGFFQTSNSNQNSTMDVSGRHATKPNAAQLIFSGKIEEIANTAGSRNLGADYFLWNSDKNYEGTTVTGATDTNGDNFSVANSAQTHQMSDATGCGGFSHYFFLRAQNFLASAHNYYLRC